MMWSMHRPRREIGKPWPVRSDRFLETEPCNGLVGQVPCQMVALRWGFRRFNGCDVSIELGVPLTSLPSLESVPEVETLPGWPAIEGTGRTGFPIGRIMPLSECSCVIAAIPQHFCNAGTVFVPDAVV